MEESAHTNTTLPNTALRAQMTRQLLELDDAAAELRAAIADRDADLHAWCPDPDVVAREHLARDLARFDHDDAPVVLRVPQEALRLARSEDDGRLTILATGLLACREDTLALAEHLNLVKQRLDETLRALDERRVTAADVTPAKDNWIGTTLLRYALHECGRSRLSRRQAVRQIRIESAAPVRASFFWAHLPRRYRTTVAELEAFLRARLDKNPSVRVDLDALEAFYRLPDSDACRLTAETQIIIERPFHLHPRCNLTFVEASGPDATRRVTRVRRAVLPILYPVAADNTVPEVHSALRPYAEPAPRKRRDDYLVGAPLGLKGIHVYRTRQVDPGVS